MKPSRYYIFWDQGTEDKAEVLTQDLSSPTTTADAISAARQVSQRLGLTVSLYERTHLEDVTPPGDPSGLLWDWHDEFIDAVTAAEGEC